MNRSLNLLAVIVIVAAGVMLYQLKYKTQHLQAEVKSLRTQIVADTEAVKVLNAEWTYLSRPERLEALGRRYLALDAVKAGQVIASAVEVAPREDATMVLAQVDDFRAAGAQFASAAGESNRPMVRPVPLPRNDNVPASVPGPAPHEAPYQTPGVDKSRPLLQVRNEVDTESPTAFLKTLNYVQAGGLND